MHFCIPNRSISNSLVFFLCHLLEFANSKNQMGTRKKRHLQEFCKIDFAFTKSVALAGDYLARYFFLRVSTRVLFFYRRVFPS